VSTGIEIKKSKVKKSEALWLMTFSDLSFVLLCFFIMLLTFSEPKKDKYDQVATGLSAIQTDQQNKKNLKYMSEKIEKVIRDQKLEKMAEVTLDTNGLAIEFKNAALFSSGSARPNGQYKKVVGKVLKAIAQSPKRYKIKVEGHTDDERIRSKKYRSNWDLASARGIAILDQLKAKKVSETRMSVVSYAHTKPKVPYLNKNKTFKKGKALKFARAANRRVVIRIE
jgi:chemotaxis protein MotB